MLLNLVVTDQPMISRHWIGIVRKEKELDYVQHLEKTVMPNLGRNQGVINAYFLKREVKEGVEFLVVTEWKSVDAIKAFAGDDYDQAVVDPYAQSLMVTFDKKVRHYTI
jgi:heme-degrading monooxygenase HmoA